jgi:hypothetical protein
MNERELMKLKADIDQAKSKVSELRGRKDYLLQQLKTDWDCDSVKDAQLKIVEMNTEIVQLNAKLTEGIQSIELRLQGEES